MNKLNHNNINNNNPIITKIFHDNRVKNCLNYNNKCMNEEQEMRVSLIGRLYKNKVVS